MAVKIKLARFGKKDHPAYRIVVMEEGNKVKGRYLENLGTYNPLVNPPFVTIDNARFRYWLSVGAQPTKTVRALVKFKPLNKK